MPEMFEAWKNNWSQVTVIFHLNFFVAGFKDYYFKIRQSEIKDIAEKYKELRFLKKYILILRIFPILLIIIRLPGTFNRIYGFISSNDSFILNIIHVVFYSLAGFFNSIVYSYFYRSIFKCKKKSELLTNQSV